MTADVGDPMNRVAIVVAVLCIVPGLAAAGQQPPARPPETAPSAADPAGTAKGAAAAQIQMASVKEDAAAERQRWQKECPDCVRVLISQADHNQVLDNRRTRAQDDWLKHTSKKLRKGKGLKIWVTPYRENADYNIVWTLRPMGGVPAQMGAGAVVQEIDSSRQLYSTWHESLYWDVEHPERECLQETIGFLESGRKLTTGGYEFPHWQSVYVPR